MSASLSTTASEGGISSDHRLDFAIKDKIEGGKEMPVRRCVVIHFDGGHSAKSSIDFWRTPQAKNANAHLVIDRDGTVFQCRPFNRTCGHAGVSRWRDPRMTLAGMSCFIVADITNPKNSPLELQAIVPNYMTPFVPIIQQGRGAIFDVSRLTPQI